MKVTKFGHCCLLINENDVRILLDPGVYSNPPADLKADTILITHQHPDHLNMEMLKNILSQNPNCPIYTCEDVSAILSKEGIISNSVKEGQEIRVKGIPIKVIGKDHAIIYQKSPCLNHGFHISNKLFFPGDALTIPHVPVDILALPVAAPWLKLSDAIEYALRVKPQKCFPVHDGGLKNTTLTNRVPGEAVTPHGIQWIVPEDGKEMEF